jgi:hypothetical protein
MRFVDTCTAAWLAPSGANDGRSDCATAGSKTVLARIAAMQRRRMAVIVVQRHEYRVKHRLFD